MDAIERILPEDERREAEAGAPFDPLTGEGSTGERVLLELSDFVIPRQWIPREMLDEPVVAGMMAAGSISGWLRGEASSETLNTEHQTLNNPSDETLNIKQQQGISDGRIGGLRREAGELLIRLRWRYDFAFWAASLVYIKNKQGGNDVLFRLSRPQRKLVEMFEGMRLRGEPIRVIVLKARQWGGSTATQLYMAWLQLVHRTGLNSLIIAHVRDGAVEIKDMFERMMGRYPEAALYETLNGPSDETLNNKTLSIKQRKMEGVGGSQNIQRIPARGCKIKIGTAEKPDSCRGGDYSLVHLSEVGVWKKTEGKSPEEIVQSACSGVLYRPYTMVVYESTAKGTGNFFQREYDAAKQGKSQFRPLFISWYDIEQNRLDFDGDDERRAFARQLWERRRQREADSGREEPGAYMWSLWEKGATLAGLRWYEEERKKFSDHGGIASEAPSDDVEAFVHSGAMVFDRYRVEALRKTCRDARWRGEVEEATAETASGMQRGIGEVRFYEDSQGALRVWALPEGACEGSGVGRREWRVKKDGEEWVTDRYLTVVDIGGRSGKSDWSVITVFDRMDMMDSSGKAEVVAQWRGHIDMDLLAWKAARIAKFYDDSLLVIESNTLETHDRERSVEGDQSHYILNQIRDAYENLYARRQSEDEIREGLPKKYGFHTNVKTKPLVISTLVKAVREGLYIERDVGAIEELLTYERKDNGAYGAITGKHDDILMTRAIGLHVCFSEMEVPRVVRRGRYETLNTKHQTLNIRQGGGMASF